MLQYNSPMALYTKIKDVEVQVGYEVELLTTFIDNDSKEKKQKFSGVIIAIKNTGMNKSFTVRKMTRSGVGVERIFPVESPQIESVKIITKSKVRRAKLYYMRGKIGKRAMEV